METQADADARLDDSTMLAPVVCPECLSKVQFLFKDRQSCNRDERISDFFRDGLSIGGRSASPIKPPQGAYLSRVGTERCGNGFEFYWLLNE